MAQGFKGVQAPWQDLWLLLAPSGFTGCFHQSPRARAWQIGLVCYPTRVRVLLLNSWATSGAQFLAHRRSTSFFPGPALLAASQQDSKLECLPRSRDIQSQAVASEAKCPFKPNVVKGLAQVETRNPVNKQVTYPSDISKGQDKGHSEMESGTGDMMR